MPRPADRASESPLAGAGVVVVGASAGIGRAAAVLLGRAGARLVVAARRRGHLEELAAETNGVVEVVDVRQDEDCRRLAATAEGALGRVDLLLHTVGYAPLQALRDTDAGTWQQILATNVVGANQVIRALLPVLSPGGLVTVLSSESVGNPRWGLGPYAASKAALEESLRAWRREEPGIRFCCAAIGATVPTEFGAAYAPELLESTLLEWSRWAMIPEYSMDTEHLAAALVGALAGVLPYPGVGMESLLLRSPAPAMTPTSDVAEIVARALNTERTR